MSARIRQSRGSSNKGSNSRRGQRVDSSRRPKPFRPKSPGSPAERRAAANSVFADAPAGRLQKSSDNGEFVESGHRLQKILAAAGFGSRRNCEELIESGRVEVDGRVVTELGVRVFPNEQKIRVDGEALPKSRPTYVAFNKPKNTLCTNNDPQGRRRVVDFMPPELGRLFPIGRLDQNSEGLILLTNDGALAERLTHPRFEVPKKYRVQVAGLVDFNLVRDLERGVHIAEGVVQADEVVIKSSHKLSSVLEITLKEGKNREIRRMLARLGHKVMQLQRVQVGPIKLSKMAPGEFRRLTSREVAELYRAAQTPSDAKRDDSPRPQPIELADVERRMELKEEERQAKLAPKKGAPRGQKTASKFEKSSKKPPFGTRGERDERGGRDDRRAPNPDFREEFRSEERRDERRRTRREYDNETRTIGPRKFDRAENNERRDRFNADASAPRRPKTNGSRFGDNSGRSNRPGGNRPGGNRPRGK